MHEIIIQALTAFSLVLTGLLIGYFLWFQRRSGQLLQSEPSTAPNRQVPSPRDEVHKLRIQVSRLQQKRNSLEQLCNDLLQSRALAQRHAQQFDAELYRCRAQIGELRQRLTHQSTHQPLLEQLQQSRKDVADLKEELRSQWEMSEFVQQTSIQLATERLDATLTQRDQALDCVNRLQREVAALNQRVDNQQKALQHLRESQHANREQTDPYPRIHDEGLMYSQVDQLARDHGGTVTIDPLRGPVFVEPPRQQDDLKKIHGVGRILEEKLNQLGVYSYQQILNWDDQAIREFSKVLVFKDRIIRDDWLGQAARLFDQKANAAA